MKSNKIDSLLKRNDKKYTDVARYLGRTKQSVYFSKKTGSWSGRDLIKIAELNNCNLAFISKDGEIIEAFNINDLKR